MTDFLTRDEVIAQIRESESGADLMDFVCQRLNISDEDTTDRALIERWEAIKPAFEAAGDGRVDRDALGEGLHICREADRTGVRVIQEWMYANRMPTKWKPSDLPEREDGAEWTGC